MEKRNEVLKTERLLLSPFDETDRSQMVAILCNQEIKKTYMIPDFADQKEAGALFERLMNFSKMDNHFVYAIRLNNRVIGFINDCEMNDAMVELGYVITPDDQGNGFATEAVQCCIDELFRMGIDRVRAGFFENNIPSKRVMEKCGMHKIDLEEDIEYKGVLHHCMYYEIHRTQ